MTASLRLFDKQKKLVLEYQFFSSYDILDRPVRQIYFERVVRENIFPLLRNIHWREIEKILWNLAGLDQKKNSVMKFFCLSSYIILASIMNSKILDYKTLSPYQPHVP